MLIIVKVMCFQRQFLKNTRQTGTPRPLACAEFPIRLAARLAPYG
jgi:hypothetical protein